MADFEDSYEELYLCAFRAARRIVGDMEASRDVASEAVARAFSRWGRIESYAQPWVTRVAANLALDTVRRRTAPLAAPMPMGEPTLDRLVIAAELARLPRRQREAIVLRYLLDMDEAQTAQVLGVTTGTVHTHVNRGLANIRGHMTSISSLELRPSDLPRPPRS
jgi:DNA-directed RNA polymerase specialized sigma24 family protein